MSRVAAALPAMPAAGVRYHQEGRWRRGVFLDDLHARALAEPGRLVYTNIREPGGEPRTVTFGELAGRVERMAAVLWSWGVRPGHVVAFRLPDHWESAALWLACGRVGAVAMSLSPSTGRRETELMLAATEPRLLIGAADGGPAIPGGPGLTASLDELLTRSRLAEPLPTADRPRVSADDACQVVFTSGTTGSPKAVLHSYNTLYACVRTSAGLLPSPAVVAADAGLTHSVGLGFLALKPLLTGSRSVFMSHGGGYDAEAWLDLVAGCGVTCLVTLPTWLGRLNAAQRRDPRDLSRLRRVLSAGAPLPAPVAAGVRALLAPCLMNVYGLTEAGAITSTAPDDPGDPAEESIGRAMPGMTVEVRDDGSGTGPLRVRGAALCRGMLDIRTGATTWTPADDDGWYDTGDVGRRDERGRLRYVSRSFDRVGWRNMIPVAEVESELLAHPAVVESALVGVPDHDGHEAACAVIIADGVPPSLADLCSFLRARHMSEEFLPVRLAVAETVPRTPMGKIDKASLRHRLVTGELAAESHGPHEPQGPGDRREPL